MIAQVTAAALASAPVVIRNWPPLACCTVADGASWKREPPTLNERPVASAFNCCVSTVDKVFAGGVWPELCAQVVVVIAARARVLNRMVVFIISAPERGS